MFSKQSYAERMLARLEGDAVTSSRTPSVDTAALLRDDVLSGIAQKWQDRKQTGVTPTALVAEALEAATTPQVRRQRRRSSVRRASVSPKKRRPSMRRRKSRGVVLAAVADTEQGADAEEEEPAVVEELAVGVAEAELFGDGGDASQPESERGDYQADDTSTSAGEEPQPNEMAPSPPPPASPPAAVPPTPRSLADAVVSAVQQNGGGVSLLDKLGMKPVDGTKEPSGKLRVKVKVVDKVPYAVVPTEAGLPPSLVPLAVYLTQQVRPPTRATSPPRATPPRHASPPPRRPPTPPASTPSGADDSLTLQESAADTLHSMLDEFMPTTADDVPDKGGGPAPRHVSPSRQRAAKHRRPLPTVGKGAPLPWGAGPGLRARVCDVGLAGTTGATPPTAARQTLLPDDGSTPVKQSPSPRRARRRRASPDKRRAPPTLPKTGAPLPWGAGPGLVAQVVGESPRKAATEAPNPLTVTKPPVPKQPRRSPSPGRRRALGEKVAPSQPKARPPAALPTPPPPPPQQPAVDPTVAAALRSRLLRREARPPSPPRTPRKPTMAAVLAKAMASASTPDHAPTLRLPVSPAAVPSPHAARFTLSGLMDHVMSPAAAPPTLSTPPCTFTPPPSSSSPNTPLPGFFYVQGSQKVADMERDVEKIARYVEEQVGPTPGTTPPLPVSSTPPAPVPPPQAAAAVDLLTAAKRALGGFTSSTGVLFSSGGGVEEPRSRPPVPSPAPLVHPTGSAKPSVH